MRVQLLLMLLAGCGRVGFDPSAGDAGGDSTMDAPIIPPGQLAVRVMSDRYTAAAAAPVPNVRVVKIEGAVPTTAMTDAQGRVVFDVDGPAEIRVGYVDTKGNQVAFTVLDAPQATQIELGGRLVGPKAGVTIHLPTDPGSNGYKIYLPVGCGEGTNADNPDVFARYFDSCEGLTVPFLGVSFRATANPRLLTNATARLDDAGDVDVTGGTWQATMATQMTVSNLPAGAVESVIAPLSDEPVTQSFIDATQTDFGAAVGSTALPTVYGLAAPPYVVVTARIDQLHIAGQLQPFAGTTYDASTMLPFIQNISYGAGLVSWTVPASASPITLVEGSASPAGDRWTIIAPAGTTAVAFPTDVGLTAPPDGTMGFVVTTVLADSYRDAVPTAAGRFTARYDVNATSTTASAVSFGP